MRGTLWCCCATRVLAGVVSLRVVVYRRATKLLRELFSITVGSLELASPMFPFKNDLQTFVAGVSQISPWNMIFVICLTCRAAGRAAHKSF